MVDGFNPIALNARHNIVSRKKTKVSQKEPEDIEEKLKLLGTYLTNLIFKNPDIPDVLILNMDETPVYLDMVSNTTLDIRGAKEVLVQTTGQEKQRVTVVLTVTAAGTKLKPMVIFKGKDSESGRILKEFSDREKYCDSFSFPKIDRTQRTQQH